MKKLIVVLMLIAMNGCQKETLQVFSANDVGINDNSVNDLELLNLDSLILPESDHYDSIPQDPLNPITPQKVRLGKLLFHEAKLAGNPRRVADLYTYSCASCHHAEAGFQSGLAQGIGEGGSGFGISGESRIPSPDCIRDSIDVQPIRTPTVLNTAYQEVMTWNGGLGATGVNAYTQYAWTGAVFSNNFFGYQGLETLGIAGIKKHRFSVDTTWLKSNAVYRYLFNKAFSDLPPGQRVTTITVALALAAYERTILASQSPFQRWLKGDKKALTADENAGRRLFFGKAKCYKCHNGPALNSMAFYALGMNDMQEGQHGAINVPQDALENKGRGGFTGKTADMYKFKVPQLYNLKDVHFFGHGASFTSVTDVVIYKNKAVPQNPNVPASQLSKQFVPLNLTGTEISQIVKFIENGLYDPRLKRYSPASVPSGSCIPNNDFQSKVDRGCN